jgi:hypothetical protein
MPDAHANYLLDLGREIRQSAEAAKREADTAGANDQHFARGRSMAYYEVITLMHQQAIAFGLPLADVGLQGLDPGRDLL